MLSIVLIVKNEEKNLSRCLDSIRGLGDELVIVDTGSTDKTVEIAKSYTDKVYYFTWVKDFSKARNFSFSKCTNPWIMWLDADDVLHQKDIDLIKRDFERIKNNLGISYVLMNYHYTVVVHPEAGIKGWSENDTPTATLLRERIIRKDKAVWVGRCHEHIPVDFLQSVNIDAAVWHMRTFDDMKADFQRNIELMKLEIQENPSDRNYFYLAQELLDSGKQQDALESYAKAYDITQHLDIKFQSAYKVAICFKNLDKTDESIEWFLKAIKEQVDYREPFIELAALYFFKKKDFKKAAQWVESALNISQPSHPFMAIQKSYYSWLPHDLLSKCYFNLGQFKKALEASEKLYEITRAENILEDIANIKACIKSTYKNPSGTVRLNLGCGGKPEPGYVNCDLFPGPGVDEVFSLDEIPYSDGTVDEITSEHALEHLPRLRSHAAITEWARVLKPGGLLKLKIPDVELCAQQFVNDIANREWWGFTLYGVQDYRNDPVAPFKDKVNYGQIHYTGFTKDSISKLLLTNGFIINDIHNYNGWGTLSISVTARKKIFEGSKKIAFINNSLIPRYLSYGDYWLDAFRLAGHQVTEFRYENIKSLPKGFDLYFFIEKRYEPSEISLDAHPRVLYTQENQNQEILKHYDYVCSSDLIRTSQWSVLNKCLYVPNSNHSEGIKQITDWVISGIFSQPKQELVDIVIPSYKNLKYLQLTINSVRKNTTNYNLIVCNSGNDEEVRSYLQAQTDIKLIDTTEKRSFSQNINSGLRLSNNDVVLLNNDVIVGRGWLEALRNSKFDITNPYSNCDMGWIHNYSEIVGDIELHPNMTIDQVNVEELSNFSSPRNEIISRPWVAFYATYIRRRVISAVGLLDDMFLNGGEDFDYCNRAAKMGFTCGHVFSSWVFHFGGKTRKVSENENYAKHHEEDAYNQKVMHHKTRKTIGIFTGPAYERWTINTINTTGIGGSETCAALLAKELVKKDYRVLLIGDCDGSEGNYDGVEYYDWKKLEKLVDTNYFDYFISSRTLHPFSLPLRSKKNYVWVHDIWLSGNRYLGDTSKVDKFICLSPWHIDFFTNHHGISRNKIAMQPNGLDTSRYSDFGKIERDPYRLFYSSSPDRGLLTLLRQFKILKEEFPKLNLHIYYGFFNWKSAAEQRKNAEELEYIKQLELLIKQNGIVYHDRVAQNILSIEQMKSSLWVYPTEFTETFCLTQREAMLAGAVPICTNLAALATTMPDECGIKVSRPDDCLNATRLLLNNLELQENYRKLGREYSLKYSDWSYCVNSWIQMFESS